MADPKYYLPTCHTGNRAFAFGRDPMEALPNARLLCKETITPGIKNGSPPLGRLIISKIHATSSKRQRDNCKLRRTNAGWSSCFICHYLDYVKTFVSMNRESLLQRVRVKFSTSRRSHARLYISTDGKREKKRKKKQRVSFARWNQRSNKLQ